MQFRALSARNIYWITPLIIILAYNLLHWRHTSKFLDSSLLHRFRFKPSIIRKRQVNLMPPTINFLICNFWLIDSISGGKSCLKCISQPKIRFGCWVALPVTTDPLPVSAFVTSTGLRYAPVPGLRHKVRPGRQSRAAKASGLRLSALASRPPALPVGLLSGDGETIFNRRVAINDPSTQHNRFHGTIDSIFLKKKLRFSRQLFLWLLCCVQSIVLCTGIQLSPIHQVSMSLIERSL